MDSKKDEFPSAHGPDAPELQENADDGFFPEDYFDDDGWDDDLEGLGGPSPFMRRIIALLTVAAVGLFLLGGVLRIFQIPALDFIDQSQRLAQETDVQNWRRAVVGIRAERAGGAAVGTGFNIDPRGLVVTNRHIVEGALATTITFENGVTFAAGDVWLAEGVDLAVIPIAADTHLESVPLAPPREVPEIGERIIIIGNPLGFTRVAVEGTVTGYRGGGAGGADDPPSAIVLEAPIHRGHSGSPVFDSRGRVAGVVYATLSSPDSPPGEEGRPARGLAVSSQTIAAFIRHLAETEDLLATEMEDYEEAVP